MVVLNEQLQQFKEMNSPLQDESKEEIKLILFNQLPW